MRKRFVPTLAAVLALLASRPAHAFSYREHCEVSSNAFQLALHYVTHQSASTSRSFSAAQMHVLQQLGGSECRPRGPLTYGHLVALVDNAGSPADYYLFVRNDSAAQHFRGDMLPLSVLDELGRSTVQSVFSARLNVDHFQDRAMYGQWFWHRSASALAADDGNLVSALVLNAFSEHYLEDFFAPGHVFTPRRNFHDAASLAMHDYYNRHGASFIVRNARTLADLLAAGLPDGLARRWPTGADSVSARLKGMGALDLVGDDRLVPGSDQDILMTLVVARSVADILESYLSSHAVNHFEHYRWKGYTLSDSGLIGPQAEIAYGDYESGRVAARTFEPVIALSMGTQALFGHEAGPARVLVQVETLIAGAPGGDWIIQESGRRPILPQFGLMGGWSMLVRGGEFAQGPTARLVFPIPKLDTEFSIPVAMRWYSHDHVRRRGFSYGGGMEMGIGLGFVGLSVQRDVHFDAAGDLKPGVAVTSTFSVGAPTSRLGIWF